MKQLKTYINAFGIWEQKTMYWLQQPDVEFCYFVWVFVEFAALRDKELANCTKDCFENLQLWLKDKEHEANKQSLGNAIFKVSNRLRELAANED
jgi:hypothetical protein